MNCRSRKKSREKPFYKKISPSHVSGLFKIKHDRFSVGDHVLEETGARRHVSLGILIRQFRGGSSRSCGEAVAEYPVKAEFVADVAPVASGAAAEIYVSIIF